MWEHIVATSRQIGNLLVPVTRRGNGSRLSFRESRFRRFDFDFGPLGQQKVFRIDYEVPVSAEAFSRFVLHEGAEFRAFSAAGILSQPRVTPYDAFAIWMHYSRERFRG